LLANFYISAHPVNILFVFLPSCKVLAPNWNLCRVFHSSFTPFAPSQLHCCWKRFLAGLFSYCGEQVRLSIIRVVLSRPCTDTAEKISFEFCRSAPGNCLRGK